MPIVERIKEDLGSLGDAEVCPKEGIYPNQSANVAIA